MPTKMDKEIYLKLIKDDLLWLFNNTKDCLESRHITKIVNASVDMYYPKQTTKKDGE